MHHSRSRNRKAVHSRSSMRGCVAAFTLLEALLVSFIVGVLLSLLFPYLADLKLMTRSIRSNANMRSHATVFASYNLDHDDCMPYVTDPSAKFSILRAGEYTYFAVYFEAVNKWNIGLADMYYESMYRGDFFGFPGEPLSVWTHYNYSQVFLADPAYWRRESRIGPSQWRATRAFEVVFPSSKALLIDSQSELLRRRSPGSAGGTPVGAAIADGAVHNVPYDAFLRGYPKGTGWEWHGCFNRVLRLGMHTTDGVRGRDLASGWNE